MHRPIIITAGSAYVDIDVLASSIAYRELLRCQGYEAVICHTGPLNATIPAYLAEKANGFIQMTPPSWVDRASFILVDVSDPNHFEKFVDPTRISKVIDHHFGFESYWSDRLGDNAIIQSIGACATLIWQEYEKEPTAKISPFSAELLATAILSNTLNLQACVTTEADHKALIDLQNEAQLSEEWREKYYEGTKDFLINTPLEAIASDTKQILFQGNIIRFCQLETWDGEEIIRRIPLKNIATELFEGESWLLSLLDISSSKNWLLSNNATAVQSLQSALALEPFGEWFISNKLWLRKEILRLWQNTK